MLRSWEVYWRLVSSDLGLYSLHDLDSSALPCCEDLLLNAEGGKISDKSIHFRCYNYVKALLPNPDINVMLAASKTLGRIAEKNAAEFGEGFMEMQVQEAIGFLQADKQEPGRYAGVLILKELARNSQKYFQSHIGLVFEKILTPLRDNRIIVREGAAELLAACLEIITQRERQALSPYLLKILQDAQTGLKMVQPEIIHGSLLTYRELLLHGGMVSTLTPHKLWSLIRPDAVLIVHEGELPGCSRQDSFVQNSS